MNAQPIPTSFHVSPTGNDTAPGTAARPFATFEAAREAIRARRAGAAWPRRGVAVWIHGGDYFRTAAFTLTAADSGLPGAPVVYRAWRGEQPRLLGGRRVSGWQPVTEPAVLARLDPAARPHVVQVDLREHGVAGFGQLESRGFGRPVVPAVLELFAGGEPMTIARWPNQGFITITGLPTANRTDDGHGGQLGQLADGFLIGEDRPSRWSSLVDVWAQGYWGWDWANSQEAVASFDPATRRVTTKPPFGHYGFRPGQRLYFFNVLEELDQPGEYYLDRGSGRLYFWPPAECGDTLVSVLADPLVQLVDAAHVRLEGLTLECSRGSAVTITGGTSNLVRACTIRNTGNHGVVVTGGTGHTVDRCTIANTGDSGIRLEGGDRATLTAAGHAATNNHVHHVARWSRSYQPAIGMQGVGQRVAHNLIHDSPHTAIMFGGNEHLVECNEIHSVCLETGDVGAIYLGRDWTQRGNVIRHNYVHDLGGVGLGAMAVYLDDCTSGTTVFGNLFVRAGRAAFIGGGRDNLIENNIFIDCQPAVWVDGRGLSWHKMVYELMAESLAAMKPDQPPYSTRYPALAALRPYYAAKNGVPPEGNRVCRNICRGGQWLEILWGADPKLIDLRDNLVEVDPLFVNAAAGDYRLRRESPAWKLGFRPIPFEQIGPRPGPVAQR